jgi:hypothetical protein
MAKSHVKLISGISLKLSTHFPHMSTAGIAYFPHMSTAGIAYFPHMSAADIAYFPHMSAADIACCGVGGWFFAGDIKGCEVAGRSQYVSEEVQGNHIHVAPSLQQPMNFLF